MTDVLLRPWSVGDLPLLEKLLGDPEMMAYLGGPETPEQIARRHQRYLQLPETDHMFKIISNTTSEPLGSIGYWDRTWQDKPIYETGWFILPAYQGHGIATKAGKAMIEHARRECKHQFIHAFPSVSNGASNAICRKLDFSLVEECEFEYPPGNFMQVNDWQFDLL